MEEIQISEGLNLGVEYEKGQKVIVDKGDLLSQKAIVLSQTKSRLHTFVELDECGSVFYIKTSRMQPLKTMI